MKKFKTKIEDLGEQKFEFECFENTEPINIEDIYLFFFDAVAFVARCETEQEKEEINPNNKEIQMDKIDLVYNFWKNCYKIKSTDLDLKKVDL